MAISENLFSTTQNFFSPDIIQKFCNQIQEPIEKTKSSLKSIIPTVLMGIVNKGSTEEGAESLVNMANKQPIALSPENINTNQSNEIVNGVFGNKVNEVVSKLGDSTGMNTGSVTKILGLVTPMIMSLLGSKIKDEKLNASGLKNFLQQQKSSIAGMIPTGLFSGMTSTSAFTSSTTQTTHDQIEKKKSWGKIGLIALVALALLRWISTHKTAVKIAPITSTTVTQVAMPEMTQNLSGLNGFMSMTTGNLIKRFRFEHLNFESGTTILVAGSEVELNQIADTMKNYPAATIKIEGFTDNIGPLATNLALSTNRALEVKNELIARGIDAKRIEATGLGASSPIATNETVEGRAENRRIELIVKRR